MDNSNTSIPYSICKHFNRLLFIINICIPVTNPENTEGINIMEVIQYTFHTYFLGGRFKYKKLKSFVVF